MNVIKYQQFMFTFTSTSKNRFYKLPQTRHKEHLCNKSNRDMRNNYIGDKRKNQTTVSNAVNNTEFSDVLIPRGPMSRYTRRSLSFFTFFTVDVRNISFALRFNAAGTYQSVMGALLITGINSCFVRSHL